MFTETTLKINDVFYPVKYNQTYGYEVEFEGDGYTTYILFFYNKYGNPSMIMYSNSGTTINLYKKIPTKVPEEIIGTWEGVDATTKITAVIDKDGKLQLKIGDAAFVSIRAEYDVERVNSSLISTARRLSSPTMRKQRNSTCIKLTAAMTWTSPNWQKSKCPKAISARGFRTTVKPKLLRRKVTFPSLSTAESL